MLIMSGEFMSPMSARLEHAMPQLMFTCSRKQRPVPTNRTMKAEAFATADLDGENQSVGPCPHCGEIHAWTKNDAYFAGDRPKPAPGTVGPRPD